jgi:glycosyltransferase involved in cell wall biosynthesis
MTWINPDDHAPSPRPAEGPAAGSAGSRWVFHVVTPSLNAARYISETIESVVSQAGAFSIRYHIQDGGSLDGTLEIARSWERRVEAKDFLLGCDGVHLTVESRPDGGMYDAIAAGFRRLAPAADDVMTWINSDDRLAPGALSVVAGALQDLPQLEFVGGRLAVIDAHGRHQGTGGLFGYVRSCIAGGLHDGRLLPFVPQEGTFWRARLWARTGGIDRAFKLAGDFDLWRRFAAEAEYVTLDALTGCHRRHPGQLSADIGAYHRELDERSAEWPPTRQDLYRAYCEWYERGRVPAAGRFAARVARPDAKTGRWTLVDGQTPVPRRAVLHPIDGDWATVSGIDDPEGPFPDLGLDAQFRWIVGQPATLALFSARGGRRAVSLVVRSMVRRQSLEIRFEGGAPHRRQLRRIFPRAETLTVTHDFTPGPCRMEIRVDRWMDTAQGRRLGIILDAIVLQPGPPRRTWFGLSLPPIRARMRPQA